MKQIRFQHGDVQGYSISAIPENAKKITNKPIAYGEVTGHIHALTGEVELFELDGKIYASVWSDGARMQHVHESKMTEKTWKSKEEIEKADHNSFVLPGGMYEFNIQQSYNPYSKLMEKVID